VERGQLARGVDAAVGTTTAVAARDRVHDPGAAAVEQVKDLVAPLVTDRTVPVREHDRRGLVVPRRRELERGPVRAGRHGVAPRAGAEQLSDAGLRPGLGGVVDRLVAHVIGRLDGALVRFRAEQPRRGAEVAAPGDIVQRREAHGVGAGDGHALVHQQPDNVGVAARAGQMERGRTVDILDHHRGAGLHEHPRDHHVAHVRSNVQRGACVLGVFFIVYILLILIFWWELS
jgi:hypothetical protein